MRKFSLPRLLGVPAIMVAALVAAALPAAALDATLEPQTVHVEDCHSADLARDLAWDMEFTSNTTGPVSVDVATSVEASITLCWSLDIASGTTVDVETSTYLSVEGLVSETDSSRVCTAIDLTVMPGMTGTVSASTHASLWSSDGPPVDWDHWFAKDVAVDSAGEHVVLRACADTSGDVSAG